jgi:hypothetical protein
MPRQSRRDRGPDGANGGQAEADDPLPKNSRKGVGQTSDTAGTSTERRHRDIVSGIAYLATEKMV